MLAVPPGESIYIIFDPGSILAVIFPAPIKADFIAVAKLVIPDNEVTFA